MKKLIAAASLAALLIPTLASAAPQRERGKRRVITTEVEVEELGVEVEVEIEILDEDGAVGVESEAKPPPAQAAAPPPPPPPPLDPPPPPMDCPPDEAKPGPEVEHCERPTRHRADKTRRFGFGIGAGSLLGLHPDDGRVFANHGANFLVRFRMHDAIGLSAEFSFHGADFRDNERRGDVHGSFGIQLNTPSRVPVGLTFSTGLAGLTHSIEGRVERFAGVYVGGGARLNLGPRLVFEGDVRLMGMGRVDGQDWDVWGPVAPEPIVQTTGAFVLYF